MNITREEALNLMLTEIQEITDNMHTMWALYIQDELTADAKQELKRTITAGFDALEDLFDAAGIGE